MVFVKLVVNEKNEFSYLQFFLIFLLYCSYFFKFPSQFNTHIYILYSNAKMKIRMRKKTKHKKDTKNYFYPYSIYDDTKKTQLKYKSMHELKKSIATIY